ncbi:unnamed protein product [Urochloa humidicola]
MEPARPPLQGLPVDVSVQIAGRLAASSLHPMEDVCALRVTCKDMRDACKAEHVGRSIPLWWALNCEQWKPYYNRRYRDRLIHKLARVGNTEACFRQGMHVVFRQNHSALWPPLDMLERAAKDGHTTAAYTLTMCLYRRNSGAADDEKAMRLLRKVEGEEEPLPASDGGGEGTKTTWENRTCLESRHEAEQMVRTVEQQVATAAKSGNAPGSRRRSSVPRRLRRARRLGLVEQIDRVLQ